MTTAGMVGHLICLSEIQCAHGLSDVMVSAALAGAVAVDGENKQRRAPDGTHPLRVACAPSVQDHGSSFKKHLLDRSIVISRHHKAAQQKAYTHDEDYQVAYQLRSWWEPPDDVVGDKGQNPV